MSADDIIFETIKAYCLRQNRENYRPPHDLFVAFQLFAEDMIKHALMEEGASDHIDTITEPVANLLADWTRSLPKFKQGAFTTPIAPLITEEMVYDSILRFNQWPIKNNGLYASLREQLNENARVDGQILTPKDNKNFTAEFYFKRTPFMRLVEATSPFSFRDYKERHHCMFAQSGAGKTSLIAQTVWEHLHENDPPAMVIFDPHDEFIDKIEHLDYWRKHPDRLAVLDPSSKPSLNLFDQPQFDAVDAAKIAKLWDYLFGDMELTGAQPGVFYPIISLMVAKYQNGGATAQDLVEYARKPDDPRWLPFIAKIPNANTRYYLEHTIHKEKQSVQAIIRRINVLEAEPNLFQSFCAPSNKLDLFKILHEEKRTLLVRMDGIADKELCCRYVMMLLYRFAFERGKRVKDERKRHPILIFADEAHFVLNSSVIENFLTDTRKFGLFVRAYTQHLDKLTPSVRDALVKGTRLRIASHLDDDDARDLARRMKCDHKMLTFELPDSSPYLQFAVQVAGEFPTIHVRLKKGPMDRMPLMTDAQFEEASAASRRALQGKPQSAASSRTAPQDDAELNPDNF